MGTERQETAGDCTAIAQDDSEDDLLHRTDAENLLLYREWREAHPLEWGGYMLRPGMRLHPADEPEVAPNRSGIYALHADDGGLIYVGKSKALCERLLSHRRNALYRQGIRFSGFCFLPVPMHALRDVEVAHIYAMEPECNNLYEPVRWAQHAQMAQVIRKLWGIPNGAVSPLTQGEN